MANGNLETTTPENKARYVRGDGDTAVTHTTNNAGAQTLWREWPNIDATVAETLQETLLTTAQIDNPQADGETRTGRYSNADVILVENNRRWVTIRQKLIRMSTITAAADLPQPVDANRVETYRSFEYDPGEGDVLVLEYRYLDRSSRAVCMSGIAKADLTTAGYTLEARRWVTEARGDRTCTFVTFQRKVTWSNINDAGNLPDTWRTMGEKGYYAGQNFLKHKRVDSEMAYGVPIDNADDILTELKNEEDPVGNGYATKSVTVFQRQNGEVWIGRDTEQLNTDSALSSAILLQRDMDISNGTPKRFVGILPNLLDATATNVLNTLRSTTVITVDGTAYRNAGVRREPRDSGLSDIFIIGKIAGSGSLVKDSYAIGDTFNFQQRIRVSDDGVRYRVVFSRRVTDVEQDAVDWADASSDRPVLNGRKAHKGGKLDYAENLGLWIAIRERWTSDINNYVVVTS